MREPRTDPVVESGVHHNGMTTAWPPNKATPGKSGGKMYPDVDINSRTRNSEAVIRRRHGPQLSLGSNT